MKCAFEFEMEERTCGLTKRLVLRLPYFFEDSTLAQINKAFRYAKWASDEALRGFEEYMRTYLADAKKDFENAKKVAAEHSTYETKEQVKLCRKHLERCKKICTLYEKNVKRHPNWK